VIYIAPLKALVRERMNDWGKGLCKRLGKRVVELTGGGGGSGSHGAVTVA
jgi:activating signal cointegrator complex subunit 3